MKTKCCGMFPTPHIPDRDTRQWFKMKETPMTRTEHYSYPTLGDLIRNTHAQVFEPEELLRK